jgi:hypothetical protein
MANDTTFMPITKDGYVLVHKVSGNPVEQGRVCPTIQGDLYRIVGGTPNLQNPASSGKVYCYLVDEDGESDWQRTFYPSVFGLKWVKEGQRSEEAEDTLSLQAWDHRKDFGY